MPNGFMGASPAKPQKLRPRRKSPGRVKTALTQAGVAVDIVETGSETGTAEQAAVAAGCPVDQIARPIIFHGDVSGATLAAFVAKTP